MGAQPFPFPNGRQMYSKYSTMNKNSVEHSSLK